MINLFRRDALDQSLQRLDGSVLLIQPFTHHVYSALGLVSLVSLVLTLVFVKYTRHVDVSGVLEPTSGMAKVYAPQAGKVTGVKVDLGTVVRRGQVLITLSTEHMSKEGVALETKLAESASAKLEKANEELHATRQVQQSDLVNSRSALEDQRGLLQVQQEQLSVLALREKAAVSEVERYESLADAGFASKQMAQDKRNDLLDQQIRLKSLRHDALQTDAEVRRLRREIDSFPAKNAIVETQLQRAISAAQAEMQQQEDGHEWTVVSPVDGVVTSLEILPGQMASPSSPLVTLAPADSKLIAKLYVPSQSVGLLARGSAVRIKVDAFPYQKFGVVDGQLDVVSQSPIGLAEAAASTHLALAAHLPDSQQEPTFLAFVSLKQQSINAYGRAMQLTPGMQFLATIELDERPLYQWALEPLLASSQFKI